MPTQFIPVGSHWINLELVTSIEIVNDPKSPLDLLAARVHFSNGKTQDFTETDEVKQLAAWLANHRAP